MRLAVVAPELPGLSAAADLDHLLRTLSTAALAHRVTLVLDALHGRDEDATLEGFRQLRRVDHSGSGRGVRCWWEQEGRGEYDAVLTVLGPQGHGVRRSFGDTPHLFWMDRARPTRSRWTPTTRAWDRLADRVVITRSESSRALLAAHGVHDVVVLPPGHRLGPEEVAAGRITPAPLPTVAWRGTMDAAGRPADALEALEEARRRIPDLQAVMIGDGPLLPHLRRTAGGWVQLPGLTDRWTTARLIATAHVALSTERPCAWSTSVTEAAVLGVPAVGYDVDGVRDALAASGGTVVPPEPSAAGAALADRLARLTWPGEDVVPLDHARNPGLVVPQSGALPWESVADRLMETVARVAGLPRPAQLAAAPRPRQEPEPAPAVGSPA